MKKSSKILIFILSLALIIAALAVIASATTDTVCKIDQTEYTSIKDAIAAAESGATVKLTANATVSEAIEVTKDVTINLSGKTLSIAAGLEGGFKLATADVELQLIGNGYVIAESPIYKMTANAKVTLSGTKQGILVEHKATDNTGIISAGAGTSSFTKVGVISYTPMNATSAYFALSGDARFIGSELSFVADANSVGKANSGVFMLRDNIYVKLTDSSVFTPASAVTAAVGYNAYRQSDVIGEGAGAAFASTYGVAMDLDNVYFEGGKGNFTLPDEIMNYTSYDTDDKEDTTAETHGDATIRGTVNISGGQYISKYRNFVSNLSQDNLEMEQNFSIVAENAIIINNDCDVLVRLNIDFTFKNCLIHYGGDKFTSDHAENNLVGVDKLDKSHGKAITLGLGTRLSSIPAEGDFVYSDGSTYQDSTTFEIVFDAIGNKEYPYVVVEKGSVTVKPDKSWFFPFHDDDEGKRLDNDSALTSDGSQVGLKNADLEKFQTIHNDEANNTYVKYWLERSNLAPGSTASLNDGQGDSGGKHDSFYVIGSKRDSSTETAIDIAKYKVAVYTLNFTADSEYGYLNLNIRTAGFAGGSDKSPAVAVTTKNNSIIPNGQSTGIALDNYKWHSLAIVCDNVHNVSYYYLDGELLTTSAVYGSGATHLQGIRIWASKGETQTVGAGFAFDNFSCAAYENALYTDTTNATLDATKYVPASQDADKWILPSGEQATTVLPYSVLGVPYASLNNALKTGHNVSLNKNYVGDEVITENGYLLTNGYSLVTGSGSNAAVCIGSDASPFGTVYNFDAAYNEYTAKVYWYIGGINGDVNDLTNTNGTNYVVTEVRAGTTPNFTEEVPDCYEKATLSKNSFNGKWTDTFGSSTAYEFAPITANEILNCYVNGEFFTFYALYDKVALDFTVENSVTGAFSGGLGASEFYNALGSLTNGDTLTMLTDLNVINSSSKAITVSEPASIAGIAKDNSYTSAELTAMKEAASKIALDLNGHILTYNNRTEILYIGSNVDLSVYSSRAGGEIIKLGGVSDGKFNNYRAFAIGSGNSAKGTGWGTYNAHITIGSYKGQYSGNLSTYTAILVEGLSGDSSCSITIDGGTFVRATGDSHGLVLLRCYNGPVYMTNSTFLLSHSKIVGIRNDYYTGAESTIPDTWEKKTINTKVRIENSLILMSSNGDNVMDYNGASYTDTSAGTTTRTLTIFKNCITNGRINPAGGEPDKSCVGQVRVEGTNYAIVSSKGNHVTTSNVSGKTFTQAKANIPFTLPNNAQYLTYPTSTYTSGDAAISIGTGYFKLSGATMPEADDSYMRKTTLPLLNDLAITPTTNVVKVKFMGVDGVALGSEEKYVKGGNAIYSGAALEPVYTEITKVSHTGGWVTPTTNLQSSVSIYPETASELAVSGFKTGLALYSDFAVHLYVPAKYVDGNYITDTNGLTLSDKVTVGADEYYVLSKPCATDEVADGAVFTLEFTEDDFTDDCSFTVSIVKYAETILKDSLLTDGNLFTADDYSLMWYILNYAKEAYTYFATANDDNAEEIAAIAELLTTYASCKGDLGENTYGDAITNLELGNVFDGISVSLDSTPSYVLVVKEGFVGSITVSYTTYNGGTVTLNYSDSDIVSGKLKIEGIRAYNFIGDIVINVTGTVGEDEATLTNATYNLDTFVKYHIDNAADTTSATRDESAACLELLYAFYDYLKAATDYKN